MHQSMRFECYGESLTLERGRVDGDTFLVDCEETPLIALCDSIRHAGRPPRRTLELFRRLFAQAQPEEIGRFSTWAHWMGLLDFALLRRSQSAFVAVAAVGDRIIGAAVGSCRAYLFDGRGGTTALVGDRQQSPNRLRLGTGDAKVSPIELDLQPQDLLLLLSEAAWTPLRMSELRRAVAGAHLRHVAAASPAVLQAAASRSDSSRDMTVVALQRIE